MIAVEMDTLREAAQMNIWRYVWRENYAQTILAFANHETISEIDSIATQPELYVFKDHHNTDNPSSSHHVLRSSHRRSPSMNFFRCTIM